MTFLRGLWHGLKVTGVAVYVVLTVYFLWSGLIMFGHGLGWACFAVVLAVFAIRGLSVNRGLSRGASYVLAAGLYLLVLFVASALF
jgi:hypothetical protein